MKAGTKRFLVFAAALASTAVAFAQERASDVEIRIREAEARMQEAARQIAELSAAQMARMPEVERRIRMDGRPVLGINVGSDEAGPVEGVEIMGVTPGAAADDAGLRAGDFVTAINGESMSGDSGRDAVSKLLDFMQGVEEGDVLDVEYLRNGKTDDVELKPRKPSAYQFAFRFDGDDFKVPLDPVAPGAAVSKFIWLSGDHGWGDMELVELSEKLGSYFGTRSGLLVVRAPQNDSFKLQDGDVIRSIDGREPTSVRHAMRILGSYESGEKLEIDIMRDQRQQTLEIEIPDNRRSALDPPRVRQQEVRRHVMRRTGERS
ncbi:MAG: PDZ domain-containing protein [Gammaproteobacteria bacterium]|nr:PDZ domain-containing protein [Gammaproteobacteria bacterium]